MFSTTCFFTSVAGLGTGLVNTLGGSMFNGTGVFGGCGTTASTTGGDRVLCLI